MRRSLARARIGGCPAIDHSAVGESAIKKGRDVRGLREVSARCARNQPMRTGTNSFCPLRSISNATWPPALSTCRFKSSSDDTFAEPTLTITSPAWMPARAAGPVAFSTTSPSWPISAFSSLASAHVRPRRACPDPLPTCRRSRPFRVVERADRRGQRHRLAVAPHFDVHLRSGRHVADAARDVGAVGDRDVVDLANHVAGLEAGLVRRAVLLDRADERAVRVGQAEALRQRLVRCPGCRCRGGRA